jgi:N-methylhydantoinase A
MLETFETPYYDRATLPTGQALEGPAILLQTDSTTVVPPGWEFRVDEFDNVLITRDDDGESQ